MPDSSTLKKADVSEGYKGWVRSKILSSIEGFRRQMAWLEPARDTWAVGSKPHPDKRATEEQWLWNADAIAKLAHLLADAEAGRVSWSEALVQRNAFDKMEERS